MKKIRNALLALMLAGAVLFSGMKIAEIYRAPEDGEIPARLLELMERNPETGDFVLSYPAEHDMDHPVDLSGLDLSQGVPLLMQWDKRWGYIEYGGDFAALTGCGPVCLSMVACYLTGDTSLSPDRMLEFAEENGYSVDGSGSSWTLISQGAAELGLSPRELPLDKAQVEQSLAAGEPVICVMGPGDFTQTGHFIVLTGMEEGLLRINDPNSRANSEKLWDFDDISGQIKNLWAIGK